MCNLNCQINSQVGGDHAYCNCDCHKDTLPAIPPSRKRRELFIIFTRDDKYLTEDYKWSDLPTLFPSWQASAVMRIADRWKNRPTGWAVVSSKCVDLDKLDIQKF